MSRTVSAPSKLLTIYCNARFPEPAMVELAAGVGSHRLLLPPALHSSNLISGGPDPLLAQADIALGQPDPEQVIALANLRWVHLTSAGYTRYDVADVRDAVHGRAAVLTNSSSVYDEPCAEHVLAMMLALARRLPQCWQEQAAAHSWRSAEHRIESRLLVGQNVLILGFGAIARRLVELLQPFRMKVAAVRRKVGGNEPIPVFPIEQLPQHLRDADHVINVLPANPSTDQIMNAECFGHMKPHAVFYNIGRGSTVDEYALQAALQTRRLAAAYLDVTDEEPLPPHHPLWTTPNCFITPHTAGGHADEFERLVRHFLNNLRRFEKGEPLQDRVI